MDGLLRLLPGPQPLIVRYGLTIVLVLLMFSLKLGLRSGTGLYGFILYVPAVVAAALLFDRGSGYFAVAFSSALVASTLPWSCGAGWRSPGCPVKLHFDSEAPSY